MPPSIDPDMEDYAPKGAHLAVLQANGLWAAIPRFAIMLLAERPDRLEKMYAMAITDVKINHGDQHNRIELWWMCPCKQQSCTLRLKLSGSPKGHHPAKYGDEVSKLAQTALQKSGS